MDPRKKLQLTHPVHCLALGFGSGLLPKAPGTWGSLTALPIGVFLLTHLGHAFFFLLTLFCFVIGGKICETATQAMGVHDHSAIVWDEFVGIFLTLLVLPEFSFHWLAIAFLTFRVFDIFKPNPIRYFDEKWQTGFGIMIDDVIAALYAILTIVILRTFF